MKKVRIESVVAAGMLGLVLMCQQVQSKTITYGSYVSMTGYADLDFSDLLLATKTTGYGKSWVTDAGGDYAGSFNTGPWSALNPKTFVTMKTFSWDRNVAGWASNPSALAESVLSLWSYSFGVINYTFDLQKITSVKAVYAGTTLYAITVSGEGYAAMTGYDKTYGDWSISFISGGRFASSSLDFSYVSKTETTQVPDGGLTVGLLGLGLLGVGGVCRHFRK